MSNLLVFPSREWAEEYCRMLSESPEYRNAAKTWEGSILFVCTDLPDPIRERYGGRDRVGFVLDLHRGECRGTVWTENPDEADAAYVIEAKYEDWRRVINGEIGPIPALMSRKLKVTRGSLATLMRYASAALAMVKTAQKVPTRFE